MNDDRADMIVEITATDESAEKTELALYNERADERAEQRRADKRSRRLSPAMPMALRNLLLELVVGIPFFLCCVHSDNGMAIYIGGLIFAACHTAFSVFAYGHYKRICGIAEWKYVLLNMLPLIILAALAFVVMIIGLREVGAVLTVGFISIFSALYSVLYGALLSIVLGIRRRIKRSE